jgi:hypothetical protein
MHVWDSIFAILKSEGVEFCWFFQHTQMCLLLLVLMRDSSNGLMGYI